MYINFEFLYTLGLGDTDAITLMKVMQKMEVSDTVLVRLRAMGYVDDKPRLTKDGIKLVKDLGKGSDPTTPALVENIIELYVNHEVEPKKYPPLAGSKSALIKLVDKFRNKTGFSPKFILNSVRGYLEGVNDITYAKGTFTLFFDPKNDRYTKDILSHSLLFDSMCEKLGVPVTWFFTPANVKTKYMLALSKALSALPKTKGTKEYYFSGTSEGDRVQLERVHKVLMNEIKGNS